MLVVPEARAGLLRQLPPPREPHLVPRRLVERQTAVPQRRVVLQKGRHRRPPARENPQQPAIPIPHLAQDALRSPRRRRYEARLLQQRPGPRQRLDRQPVPRCDHFRIRRRRNPLRPRRQQRRPAARQRVPHRVLSDPQPAPHRHRLMRRRQNRLPLEIPADVHPPVAARDLRVLRRQQIEQLLPRPHEILPLHPLRVRIRRGVERPLRRLQTVQQVLAGFRHNPPKQLVARQPPRIQIERDQQRVVVQHLLEMRHQPDPIHRVAVKPARQLVVNPALRHPPQRQRQMLPRRLRIS